MTRAADQVRPAVPKHKKPTPPGLLERPPTVPLLLLGAGLDCWAVGCVRTSTDELGPWGLLPALSALWWVGAVLTLFAVVLALTHDVFSRATAAVTSLGLGLVLLATPALVEPAPHYTYVYKHLGVTRYVMANGTVDPAVDLYHRWPAGFALGAYVTDLTGYASPLSLAAWTEVVLSLLVALLVVAVAVRAGLPERTAWTAGAFTLVLDWVGQAYYAPQGLALVLWLGMAVLLAPYFASPPLLLERLAPRRTWLVRQEGPTPGRPSAVLILAVVALHAAVVATHQLTPYVILLSLGSLAVVGLLRPVWALPLFVVLAAVTVAYLVPNYAYLDTSFGLLQGFDALGHARSPAAESGLFPVQEKVLLGRGALALHLLMWLTTLASLVAVALRGRARTALALGVMAFSPALLLVLQSYGGEARLRVFLFSMPWCALALATAAQDARTSRSRVSQAVLPVTLSVFAALFVPAYYGNEDLNTVPAGEVAAAEVLYRDARLGSVIMLAAQGFPERYGPGYPAFPLDRSDLTPAPLRDPEVLDELRAGADPVDVAVREMQAYRPTGYLVFSTTQERYARAYQLLPGEGYRELEEAVAVSPRFRRVRVGPDARVYELQGDR